MNQNPFNLPPLKDAHVVTEEQYLRLEMDEASALYRIVFPSGMYKESLANIELANELLVYVASGERVEEIIRYATNWRRIVYYPSSDQYYFVFPDGTIYRGGLGNRASFDDMFIWNRGE